MPHNDIIDTDPSEEGEWGWLRNSSFTPRSPEANQAQAPAETEWDWLDETALEIVHRIGGREDHRAVSTNVRRWAAVLVTVATATAVIVVAVRALTTGPLSAAVPSVATTSTPTPVAAGPCYGLSAPTIEEEDAEPTSLAGLITAFEYAYYKQRSAEAAMRLLAPESGIQRDPLAAGIASVPSGTKHCVAITPIADTAADVHLVEVRPGGIRTDYLQVINIRRSGTGLLITNIQKRG